MLDEERRQKIYNQFYKEPKDRMNEGLYMLGGMTGTMLLCFGFVMIYLQSSIAAVIVFVISALFFALAIYAKVVSSKEEYSKEHYDEILEYGEKSKEKVLQDMEKAKKIPQIQKPAIGPQVMVYSKDDPLVREKITNQQ